MRRADAVRGAAAAAILLAAAACGRGGAGDRRSIVLVTLDTTRADRLGCYGSRSVKTPSLDAVASGGTVFERAFTTAPVTAPAHASILSGTFPPFHQVHDNDVFRVPKQLPWLPEILRAQGFQTAAMVAAFPLRAGVGFARGFDYYGDHLEAPQGSLAVTNLHSIGVASRRGDRVTAEFRLWLEEHAGRGPFFVWLHFYDPHYPYDPPAGYKTLNPEHAYDGEIAFMDDCIGDVRNALAEKGLTDRTGLVVVADHGEALMDHGELTHALLLYNSTLRVPFVVRLPWLNGHQARVRSSVSVADVAPTVLDALGVAPPAPLQGRSLLPLISPGADGDTLARFARRPLYFETFYTFYHYGWSPLLGFVSGGWKYIHGPKDEVYDLETDMGEVRNLVGGEQHRAMSARFPSLEAELRKGRPAGSRHEPTREEVAKLQSLGYLAGGQGDAEAALGGLAGLPSPKEHMDVYFRRAEILGLALEKRDREALDETRRAIAAEPNNSLLRVMEAWYASRLELWRAADEAWAGVVRDFSDKEVLFSAGSYFLARRDLARARDCFERLTAADPEDVEALTRLGDVSAAEGDPQAARRTYEKVLALEPAHREALLGLAVALDRAGDPGAERAFSAVAEKYPFDPSVGLNYGIYLARHGRPAEALGHLRRAAAFSDGDLWLSAQFTLATWYRENGEADQARDALREIEVRTARPEALTRARKMLSELGDR
ncbi:MAG: hypothetical protein EDX89_00470 [Acidobacteria bacterium]|nr:MAG: hypothetical protein EDX89_00470 [Acidobacteriota bacterium]MCE7957977.1 hypothetical protein [Acidobacteria bacterium ACB2]